MTDREYEIERLRLANCSHAGMPDDGCCVALRRTHGDLVCCGEEVAICEGCGGSLGVCADCLKAFGYANAYGNAYAVVLGGEDETIGERTDRRVA